MRKFLEFVLHPRFVAGALAGGAGAFVAQVIFVGDQGFLAFWALNILGAALAGSALRAMR